MTRRYIYCGPINVQLSATLLKLHFTIPMFSRSEIGSLLLFDFSSVRVV